MLNWKTDLLLLLLLSFIITITITIIIIIFIFIIMSKGEFYIDGFVLCQFIEPVTFAHCTFIFALRIITLGGYLDTRINI